MTLSCRRWLSIGERSDLWTYLVRHGAFPSTLHWTPTTTTTTSKVLYLPDQLDEFDADLEDEAAAEAAEEEEEGNWKARLKWLSK